MIKEILSPLDAKNSLLVLENAINLEYILLIELFKYLYNLEVNGKKDLLVKLFILTTYSPEYFLEKFETKEVLQFKDENDENFQAIKTCLEMSDKMLLNNGASDYKISDIRESALFLMGLSFDKPYVFEYIIDFINRCEEKTTEEAFYEKFFQGYRYIEDKNFYPTELLNEKEYIVLVNTLILKGKKDYEREMEEKSYFYYSYWLWSLGYVKVKKGHSLKYIYELFHGTKLKKFELEGKLLAKCKEALLDLLKKSLFEEIEEFYIMYPIAGGCSYPKDFLTYLENNYDYIKNSEELFFFWVRESIDWQYSTYVNCIPIFKELFDKDYLSIVPIASHGNQYGIVDIYVFDSYSEDEESPIYQLKQNELQKWEVAQKYKSFKEFKLHLKL